MKMIFQKIKEIAADYNFRVTLALNPDVSFYNNVQWAGIILQFVGIYFSLALLFIIGTSIWIFGMVKFWKKVFGLYDEWKTEEKENTEEIN